MNVSVPTSGPHVYVEISSHIAEQLQNIASSSSIVEDVHICGSCKRSFTNINFFVDHKRTGCLASAHKPLLETLGTQHSQPTLGYMSSNTTNVNDGTISPLGSPYLRVIFDGGNINMEQNQSEEPQINTLQCEESSEPQALSASLAGVSEQELADANQEDFQNSSDVNSGLLQHHHQHSSSKREFQIDEEDVATLLANQLASEVVSTVDDSTIPSKTGLLDIVSEERDTLNLGSISVSESSDALMSSVGRNKVWARGNKISAITSSAVARNITSATNSVPSSHLVVPISKGNVNNTVNNNCNDASSTRSSPEAVADCPRGKRKHECKHNLCNFTTWYLKDLVRHERKHTGERPFQCRACRRSFSRADKLRLHQRIHAGDKRHRCQCCSYATHDSGSLRKHMRIHNDERPYKCQMCPYRSRDSSQLTVHLRTHTGDNPFVCTYENCSSAFKTSSDLKRHARIHTGERPFACCFCDYKCSIKSNLKVHIRLNHSEDKIVSCNSCAYVASSKRAAKEHEKSHAGDILKCGLCSYTCISASAMRNHHKIHSEDKVFVCKHCPFACRQSGYLKSHLKKKHTETARSSKTKTAAHRSHLSVHSKPFCIKSHKCTVCDAAFVREDSWRSHMRQHNKGSESMEGKGKCNNELHKDDQDCCVLRSESLLKEKEKVTVHVDKSNSETLTSASNIETSLIQCTVKDKSDKVLSGVPQLHEEVLDGSGLQTHPILLYVQNAPVLHTGLDLNQPAPLVLAGRCGSQYIQVQHVQPTCAANGAEQYPSSLPPQYILSAPLEGVAAGNTAYLQPVEAVQDSSRSMSIVSLHVDKSTADALN